MALREVGALALVGLEIEEILVRADGTSVGSITY